MKRRSSVAVALAILLGMHVNRTLAEEPGVSPQGPSAPTMLPAPIDPANCACQPWQPRGLLQLPSTWPVKDPKHYIPSMLGDFVGPVANMFSDVKIGEGDSPRPVDSLDFHFNYFNNLEKDRWTNPFQPIRNVNLYRYSFGFEKTLFDGALSLGLHAPVFTINSEAKDFHLQALPGFPLLITIVPGGPALNTTHFGNISMFAKILLWEDPETGSLLSGGAVISIPTASSQLINPGQSTLAFVQPFAGYIVCRDAFFVQGFSSVTMPVASVESIVLFNDIGVGYFVYRDTSGSGLLTAIAPTFEVHVTTPLRQPDFTANIFGFVDGLKVHNVVDFTFGVNVELQHSATLAFGAVIPVTGPKPFDFELIAHLEYRY
jgi:hypothetical protein